MGNSKGQPQASNVRPPGQGQRNSLDSFNDDGDKWKPRGPTGETYVGVISEIGKQLAFIECQPVKDRYGNDTFCPSDCLEGYNVGDMVEFDLNINSKGQPQALHVKRMQVETTEFSE